MAGLYVHIPFCKSRCKYCDFYSTACSSESAITDYLQAVEQELAMRREEMEQMEPFKTIYIGGGTPSLIAPKRLATFVAHLQEQVHNQATEITIEANPQDIDLPTLLTYKEAGVTRLSMGIQTFEPRLLQLIGRRHSREQALRAVSEAQQAGFENISVDLIYAIPSQTEDELERDLQQATALGVQHISIYNMTFEAGTELTRMVERGEVKAVAEEVENKMYERIVAHLREKGYEQYEVSNFARPGFASRHNSQYWNNTPYVGLGAAAHSYNGEERYWNIADVHQYKESIQAHCLPLTKEKLTEEDKYNERVMLSLRTREGIDLRQLSPADQAYFKQNATYDIRKGNLLETANGYRTSEKGMEILNIIIENVMKA